MHGGSRLRGGFRNFSLYHSNSFNNSNSSKSGTKNFSGGSGENNLGVKMGGGGVGVAVTTSSKLRNYNNNMNSPRGRIIRSNRQIVIKACMAVFLFVWMIWIVSLVSQGRFFPFEKNGNGRKEEFKSLEDMRNDEKFLKEIAEIRNQKELRERQLEDRKINFELKSEKNVPVVNQESLDPSLWVGVHQNVDVNILDFEFPLPKVCAGRLFYTEKAEQKQIKNDDLPWFLTDEESLLNVQTDKSNVDDCCGFCSMTSGCTAFKFQNNLCVLYSVGESEVSDSKGKPDASDLENDLSDLENQDSENTESNDFDFSLERFGDITLEPVDIAEKEDVISSMDNEQDKQKEEKYILPSLEDDEFTNEENDEESFSRNVDDAEDAEPSKVVFEEPVNTVKFETGDVADVFSVEDEDFDFDKALEAGLNEINSDVEFEPPKFGDIGTNFVLRQDDEREGSDGDESIENEVEEAEYERLPEETIFKESLQNQKANTNIAQQPLDEFLPSGDYSRHIKDPFYLEKFKFFYRFRTIKEFNDLQTQLVIHYNSQSGLQNLRAASSKPKNNLRLKYVTFGRSGDKHAIKPLKALQFGNPTRGKHVFILAGIRGCEWVPSLAVLHTTMTLLGRETTSKILDAVRFHVISMANPDGFEYSRKKTPSSAKHWCKNRRLLHNTHGVELSRNFGLDPELLPSIKTKKGKKSVDMLEMYNFSETESSAIRDYISHFTTGKGRSAVLNVRCCGGAVTPPKFYKTSTNSAYDPANSASSSSNSDAIAGLLTHLISSNSGSKYNVNHRNDKDFNKKFSGNVIDWAHSELGIDYAFEIDLKASGLTTRTNHNLISEEPFVQLSKDLEKAVVVMAQLLLAQPVEGKPVNSNFKLSIV